jgi:hypothetical protein
MGKKTHGMWKHPLYKTWCNMRQRCYNQKDRRYKDYGGRGITICDHWLWFPNFIEDVGERPEGCSVDRIDNNGNYTPENVRWATPTIQSRNRRDNNKTPYVYQTKHGTYQVKKGSGEKLKNYGNFKTFEEAKAMADTL